MLPPCKHSSHLTLVTQEIKFNPRSVRCVSVCVDFSLNLSVCLSVCVAAVKTWELWLFVVTDVDSVSFCEAPSVSRSLSYLQRVFRKKRMHHFLKNNSVKNKPILVIFGTQNPEETSHQMIINVSTSPVKCSHCTLWKAHNVHLIEVIYIKTRWQYLR